MCFVHQFSLGLFENKELRSALGRIFKGALVMSVLLFLLGNYKAWKFPLRKNCILPPHLGTECPLPNTNSSTQSAAFHWKVL